MGFSMSLRTHIPASYCHGSYCFKLCSLGVLERRKLLSYVNGNVKCCDLHGINSVMGSRKSSISNEAPEPARVLLERLFFQTQKLEEQMNGNSHLFEDVESGFDLENLESDLHAALEALRKKEEDLQAAETLVNLEYAELNQAREELEQREKKIEAACSKQERLEDELKQANLKLLSQARHIEDLTLRLNQRDQGIATRKFEVLSKEDTIDKMDCELTRNNAEALKTEVELQSKVQLLDEAHAVLRRQELEIQVLRNSLLKKQAQLEGLLVRQKLEEEKVKTVETKLEKQTMEWLSAQEELKELGVVASKHMGENKETMENFQRVRRLLTDVRSELVCSQQSLVTSRRKMEDRELLLDTQLLELGKQKETVLSYMSNLKNAEVQVERERAKLKVAEARNKELDRDLSLKRDLLQDLREELEKEKTLVQQAVHELSLLREELEKKNNEFTETSSLLEVKEMELVEARMEIQRMKSEQQSLQLVLQERDLELVTARKRLEEVNSEVTELRVLLNGKDGQLNLAMDRIKEKEDYADVMQHDLDNAKVKAFEAESVVERIVDLTKELLISTKDDGLSISNLLSDVVKFPVQLLGKPAEECSQQKQELGSELQVTRENLKTRNMELLAAKRHLTLKDEELKVIVQRLEEKDSEMEDLKEKMLRDADKFKQSSRYTQGRASDTCLEELAIQNLQLEAAQLEVETATSTLQKLVEMSRQFLNKATLCIDADLSVNVSPVNGTGSRLCINETTAFSRVRTEANTSMVGNDECLTEVKSEVTRLAALTEMLAQEAGGAPQ